MWMVVGHYVGSDKFFDRMLITILFENICWDVPHNAYNAAHKRTLLDSTKYAGHSLIVFYSPYPFCCRSLIALLITTSLHRSLDQVRSNRFCLLSLLPSSHNSYISHNLEFSPSSIAGSEKYLYDRIVQFTSSFSL